MSTDVLPSLFAVHPETAEPAGAASRSLPGHRDRAVPPTLSEGVGVPTLHHTVVEFANLDHGATAPALISVANAVDTVLRTYGSVYRGAGYASRLTTGWYEDARRTVARFVGAAADDVTIFTRNTTDSLNLLAHALPEDAQVFVAGSGHHAALLPWPAERTTRLAIPHSTREAVENLERALSAFRATSHAPALVVITGACNVTGEVWPIADLADVAHRHGARSVLDAAQLAPHRAVDKSAWSVDYVALSGHKAYAPYGSGALVGPRDWLDVAAPYVFGGGATHRVGEQDIDWAPSPARHEGGTPNAVGAVALAAAAQALTDHRDAALAAEHAAHRTIREGLAAIPGVGVLSLLEDGEDNVGVTTFTVSGYAPTLVTQVLADEYGVAVRDGRFCAHLLCDELLGDGATAVRASLGWATTLEHAQRLVAAVRTLVEKGPAFDYTHTPGVGWDPTRDERDLTEPRPW